MAHQGELGGRGRIGLAVLSSQQGLKNCTLSVLLPGQGWREQGRLALAECFFFLFSLLLVAFYGLPLAEAPGTLWQDFIAHAGQKGH